VQTAKSLVPGAKRVKIRYGPYSIPGPGTQGLTGEPGMLWNYPDIEVTKPCEECVLLNQQAGLEFTNGTNANIDKGLWLHHMINLVEGPTRWDPTCYGHMALPHFSVQSSASKSERWFSSGNERTLVPLDKMGADTKWGYHLKPEDKFKFVVDLMNMNKATQTVFLTMTFEYLDGPLPAGWKDIKPIWFDIDQCGISEVPSPQDKNQFSIASRPWKPQFDGQVVAVGGHMHDGGVNVEVLQSPTEPVCDSRTAYAETPEYITGPGLMNMDMGSSSAGGHSHGGNMKHISSMVACTQGEQGSSSAKVKAFTKPIMVSQDQSWIIKANYDYGKYEGEKTNGKWGDIMGIAIMFVAVEPNMQSYAVSTAATDEEIRSTTARIVSSIAANVLGLGWLL
jgi:hypothetical protein